MMVEEELSMLVDLPCMMVSVRGASTLFSGKPPLHMNNGSLCMYVSCGDRECSVCVHVFKNGGNDDKNGKVRSGCKAI